MRLSYVIRTRLLAKTAIVEVACLTRAYKQDSGRSETRLQVLT